jgi:predicted lipoprotein with Yx(FWY)xxD motif
MTRSRLTAFLASAAVVPLSAVAVTACGGGGGSNATGSSAPPTTARGRPATVGVANDANLGRILVDSQGRTVYLFQKDRGTKSACSGPCAAAWPPLRATRRPAIGTGLSASKVATTTRSDGKPQVTYNGHPLYRYSGDQQPGQTNGQGLNAFGASWFALAPSGNQVSGQGSAPGGPSGY